MEPLSGLQRALVPGFTTSVQEQHRLENLSISPNPFTNEIVLKGDFTDCKIEVTDVLGTLVFAHEGVSNSLTINLNKLTADIYFILVTNRDLQTSIYKVVKE